MVVAGVIMASTVYLLISRVIPLYAYDRGFVTLMPKFALICLVALCSYLVPCYLMRLPEVGFFTTRLRDFMMKSFNLT